MTQKGVPGQVGDRRPGAEGPAWAGQEVASGLEGHKMGLPFGSKESSDVPDTARLNYFGFLVCSEPSMKLGDI